MKQERLISWTGEQRTPLFNEGWSGLELGHVMSFGKKTPLLSKEGWLRHQGNIAQLPLTGADRVVSNVAEPPYGFPRSAPSLLS